MAFPRAKSKALSSVASRMELEDTTVSTMNNSTNANTPTTRSITSRNPWDRDNPFIKMSRNALILAEQMKIKTLQNETDCAKALADLPSSKLIALQREISDKNKTAVKLQQDITSHRLYGQSSDILDLKTIEKRINTLKQMCSDLDVVLRHKEKLITRLQTPFVGDFIKIDADYHKYFHSILMDLVPTITNVSQYLDHLTWVAHKDLDADLTEPLRVEVQSLMASLQTSYQMLHGMKTGIGEIRRREGYGDVAELRIN